MKIIGLLGYAGSGKSTIAHAIHHKIDNSVILPMAGPLKAMLDAYYASIGFPTPNSGPAKEAPHPALMGRSPRYAMQTLGTEWGRSLMHPDFWINAAKLRIGEAERRGKALVLIDDVRFRNELDMIWSLGGTAVRLFRPDLEKIGESEHASENIHTLSYNFGVDNYVGQSPDVVADQIIAMVGLA